MPTLDFTRLVSLLCTLKSEAVTSAACEVLLLLAQRDEKDGDLQLTANHKMVQLVAKALSGQNEKLINQLLIVLLCCFGYSP
jgi:hypothetical protein